MKLPIRLPKKPSRQPEFPFDLTGYTCFSLANCPMERISRLLKEYPDICALENQSPVPFQAAVLAEEPKWTLLRWPQNGRFFDLMNLTMWLMGYPGCPGAETPLFIALPPKDRESEGPMLARPNYDDPFMEEMLGCWQKWSFSYTIPEESLHWIGEGAFPKEYYFNGRGSSSTGFQLKWLEHLERIPEWTECSINMER